MHVGEGVQPQTLFLSFCKVFFWTLVAEAAISPLCCEVRARCSVLRGWIYTGECG